MSTFQVIGKTTCYACVPPRTKIINDDAIQATNGKDAKAVFKAKHRLCPHCLEVGTKATVEFDPLINVEYTSSIPPKTTP